MLLESLGYDLGQKIVAWSIAIVICFIAGVILILRGLKHKAENITSFRIYMNYALLLFCLGISRLFFFASDFEKQANGVSLLYQQYVLVAYTIRIFGFLCVLFVLEKYLLQFKKTILSLLYLVLGIAASLFIILAGFFEDVLWFFRYMANISAGIGGIFVLLLFLKLITITTGDLKKKAIINFFAVSFILLGGLLDSNTLIHVFNKVIWIPAIFPMVGVILLTQGQKAD